MSGRRCDMKICSHCNAEVQITALRCSECRVRLGRRGLDGFAMNPGAGSRLLFLTVFTSSLLFLLARG